MPELWCVYDTKCLDRIIRKPESLASFFLSRWPVRIALYYLEYYVTLLSVNSSGPIIIRLFRESDDESLASSRVRTARGRQNGMSYDPLYNPLSCKKLLHSFLPPYSLCRTFRDARRADVKLSFTVRSFALNSLIVTAMSLARASFRSGNMRIPAFLSYFRRKRFYYTRKIYSITRANLLYFFSFSQIYLNLQPRESKLTVNTVLRFLQLCMFQCNISILYSKCQWEKAKEGGTRICLAIRNIANTTHE